MDQAVLSDETDGGDDHRHGLEKFVNEVLALHLAIENLSSEAFKIIVDESCLYQFYTEKHICYISQYLLRSNMFDFFGILVESKCLTWLMQSARQSNLQIVFLERFLALD